MCSLKEFAQYTFLCMCSATVLSADAQRYVVSMADIVCHPSGVKHTPNNMLKYLGNLNRSTPEIKEMLKSMQETRKLYANEYSINEDDLPATLTRLSNIKFSKSKKPKPLIKSVPKASEALVVMYSYLTMAERILQDHSKEQDTVLFDNIENLKYDIGNWSSRFDSISQTLGGKRMSPKVCKKPIAPQSDLQSHSDKIDYIITIFKNCEKTVDSLLQLYVGLINGLKDCSFEPNFAKLKCKKKRGKKDSKRQRKRGRKGKSNRNKRKRRGCNELSGDAKQDCRRKREDKRRNKNKSRRINRT